MKLKLVNIKINFGLIVEMFYTILNNDVYSNISARNISYVYLSIIQFTYIPTYYLFINILYVYLRKIKIKIHLYS